MASGTGLPNTGSPVQLLYVVIGFIALTIGAIMAKIGQSNDRNDAVGPYSVD